MWRGAHCCGGWVSRDQARKAIAVNFAWGLKQCMKAWHSSQRSGEGGGLADYEITTSKYACGTPAAQALPSEVVCSPAVCSVVRRGVPPANGVRR